MKIHPGLGQVPLYSGHSQGKSRTHTRVQSPWLPPATHTLLLLETLLEYTWSLCLARPHRTEDTETNNVAHDLFPTNYQYLDHHQSLQNERITLKV